MHRLELGGLDRELVGVHAGRERDADQRLEVAPARGGVDERGEAADHAGAAQAPHAVGGGVGAQADGGAEVAPGQTPVLTQQPEDLAVGASMAAIVAVFAGCALPSAAARLEQAMDPTAALIAGLVAGSPSRCRSAPSACC